MTEPTRLKAQSALSCRETKSEIRTASKGPSGASFLEDHLMWVASVNGALLDLHFRRPEYQDGELPGWSRVPDLLTAVPDVLALCCPGSATQFVVRHGDVVYVVLCTNGKANLIVGLNPQTEIDSLGTSAKSDAHQDPPTCG